MKKLVAVFAVVLGFASVSQAGLLLEPYLGYEMGKTKNADGKMDGSQYGLRLAYEAPVFFWAGVDATMGSVTVKPDGGTNSDAKRTTIYGVVGVDFPILVRGWVAYGLSNQLKSDTNTLKGSAYKVGVGFTGLPFVSLNFEYLNEKFNDMDGATLSPEFQNDTYVVSVSLPWSF